MLLKLKQIIIWLLGVNAIVLPSAAMTLYFSDSRAAKFLQWSDDDQGGRDFAQVPFDRLDAARACQLKTQHKFEGDYLRSNIDWHSTRWQEERSQFLVVLHADIGDLREHEPATIYCYISSRTQLVNYLKAYDANGKDMLSHGISMKAMLDSFK